MRRLWFIIISWVILVGCQPSVIPDSSAVIERPPTIEAQDNRLRFSANGLQLGFYYPAGWEYYATEHGVVVTETLNTVATDGQLGGLLLHVWVPPLGDFNVPAAVGNRARIVLEQIVRTPAYIGNARVTAPTSFDWDGLEASYYLLDNTEGNVTIVLGFVLPDQTQLIAASVSAPAEQMDRIRAELPALLDALTVNDLSLSGAALDATLPPVLEFPKEVSVIPAAQPAIITTSPAMRFFGGILPLDIVNP